MFTLLTGHLMVTATLDFPVWVVAVFLVIRTLRKGQQRLWLLVGLVIGVGLLNKALPVVLALGLLVGGLMVPSVRPQLRSRWLWGGALIATAIWVPYLVWQSDHGWPQLQLAHDISSEYSTAGERLGFVALQFLLFTPERAPRKGHTGLFPTIRHLFATIRHLFASIGEWWAISLTQREAGALSRRARRPPGLRQPPSPPRTGGSSVPRSDR